MACVNTNSKGNSTQFNASVCVHWQAVFLRVTHLHFSLDCLPYYDTATALATKMLYSILFTFAVSAACYAQRNVTYEWEKYANLIEELQAKYNSDCVIIVSSKTFSSEKTLADICKKLSENFVAATNVAVVDLSQSVGKHRCRANRPLYVLLAEDISRTHLHTIHTVRFYPQEKPRNGIATAITFV